VTSLEQQCLIDDEADEVLAHGDLQHLVVDELAQSEPQCAIGLGALLGLGPRALQVFELLLGGPQIPLELHVFGFHRGRTATGAGLFFQAVPQGGGLGLGAVQVGFEAVYLRKPRIIELLRHTTGAEK